MDTAIALSGDGSLGMETKMFGARTKTAVIKFQEKYAADILIPNGLAKGTGIVGPTTRKKLNSLCASSITITALPGVTVVNPAAASSLTVTFPQQPAHTLAPNGALYVPFTSITLTAGNTDVTINKILVERSGPAHDNAFAALELLDESGFVLSTAYLRSNHQTSFNDSFTIPANTSMTVTIAGDMAADLTDYVGQVAYLQINAVEADAPMAATFPIRGTGQTINATLTIGSASATLSPNDPNNAHTNYINDTGVRFSGIRVSAGSQEDLKLTQISWEQVGTASASDIANIKTVVDGVEYPTENDGRYYWTAFPSPIILKKGNSVDVYVRGDIGITGSRRTIEFDIHYPTDLYLYGMTYGYGIYLLPGGNTATDGHSVFLTDTGDTDGISLTPFFSGSVDTISGGAFNSISK